jgi:hypothetical protein
MGFRAPPVVMASAAELEGSALVMKTQTSMKLHLVLSTSSPHVVDGEVNEVTKRGRLPVVH